MNLKEIYGNKYKVSIDPSFNFDDSESRREMWRYYEIKGHYGKVYSYAWNRPAVFFSSNIVANRIHKSTWNIIQDGDFERTILIPLEDLDMVIE